MKSFKIIHILSRIGREISIQVDAPIKVFHIIARMNVGGPAILVEDLLRNLDANAFEQMLATGECNSDEIDYLDGIKIDFRFVQIFGLGRAVSAFKDITALKRLIQEIKEFNPDIIHTHTAKAGVLGRVAGLIAKPSAKRIHTYHGHLLQGYFGEIKTRAVIVVEKVLGWISHALISVGSIVMQDLLEVGIGTKAKFHLVFPGVQQFVGTSKPQARIELGLDSKTTYVVFVGRLTQVKRPDRLIEVMTELNQDFENVHLLVVGGGELLDSVKRSAELNDLPITFYGWRKDVNRILSASDIAVLCSDNEGIPVSLIQAAQAGLPIVSTDVGSVPDIVRHDINGILVGSSTAEIANGLKVLVSNPRIREIYGLAGKKLAEEFFSSKSMMNAHEDIYRKLLN